MLFSIGSLMGIDYLINDLKSFQVHLHGLRQLIWLRGGLANLGWSKILKPMIIGVETFWQYIRSTIWPIAEPETPITEEVSVLDDQRSPDEDIDAVLSKIPRGIAALAAAGRLRPAVVSLVQHVKAFDDWICHLDFPHPSGTKNGSQFYDKARLKGGKLSFNASNLQEMEYAVRLLGIPDLSELEKSVVYAMLIVCMSSTRSEQNSAVNQRHIQHLAGELLKCPLDEEDPLATHLYIWIYLNLARTMVPGNPREQLESFPEHSAELYSGDKRLDLALKAYDWTLQRAPDGDTNRLWNAIEDRTRKEYIWSDGCIQGQRWAFNMARKWREKQPVTSSKSDGENEDE